MFQFAFDVQMDTLFHQQLKLPVGFFRSFTAFRFVLRVIFHNTIVPKCRTIVNDASSSLPNRVEGGVHCGGCMHCVNQGNIRNAGDNKDAVEVLVCLGRVSRNPDKP